MNSTGANQSGTLTDSKAAVCVVNAFFSMTAMIGNGLVLGTSWKTQALHTTSNILLFGLALSDFGVGLIVPTNVSVLLDGGNCHQPQQCCRLDGV